MSQRMSSYKWADSSPVVAQSAPPVAADLAADSKSSDWKKKILPLLFRFGLPAVTGAVLGGSNAFSSAGEGALLGLTAGGIGELKSQAADAERGDKRQAQEQSHRLKLGELGMKRQEHLEDLEFKRGQHADDLRHQRNELGSMDRYRQDQADLKADKQADVGPLRNLGAQFNFEPLERQNEETSTWYNPSTWGTDKGKLQPKAFDELREALELQGIDTQGSRVSLNPMKWFNPGIDEDLVENYGRSYDRSLKTLPKVYKRMKSDMGSRTPEAKPDAVKPPPTRQPTASPKPTNAVKQEDKVDPKTGKTHRVWVDSAGKSIAFVR